MEAAGGDGWIERFTLQLDAILAPFKANLTATNYDMLLHIAIADVAVRLERAVLQKRFNQIGGLQLDKDLRKLVAYFSSRCGACDHTTRDMRCVGDMRCVVWDLVYRVVGRGVLSCAFVWSVAYDTAPTTRSVRASHAVRSSQLSVRADFARLTQIASLLNLSKAAEVMDYWGENAGQMTWRLTPGEVRKALSRRVDFTPAQIAALKLT